MGGAHDDEKPIAPAATAPSTIARIASISSAVAASWPSAPSTERRTAEWPTITPMFTAGHALDRVEVLGERVPRPRHADLERRERDALDAGEHPHHEVGVGTVNRPAIEKPQFPAITEVHPNCGDGVHAGSQNTCASWWVWMSTKPGARRRARRRRASRAPMLVAGHRFATTRAVAHADVHALSRARRCRRRRCRP